MQNRAKARKFKNSFEQKSYTTSANGGQLGKMLVAEKCGSGYGRQSYQEMSERDKFEKKHALVSLKKPHLSRLERELEREAKAEKIELLRLFREEHRRVKKEVGNAGNKRLDLVAFKRLEQSLQFPIQTLSIGPVSGVDVGDEFQFRIELVIVGLHSKQFNGIDYVKCMRDNVVLATSIVSTEGYFDDMMKPDELIYTGEGGTFEDEKRKNGAKDQELKCGNLALYNSMKERKVVRVIRGIKPRHGHVISHGRSAGTVFVYDGLYNVVDCQKERICVDGRGKMVFKFKLERCPDQKPIEWKRYK